MNTWIQKKETIYVKNMVCPRCIDTVKKILDELNLKPVSIELGQVQLVESPNTKQLSELANKLTLQGFELLEDQKSRVINQIKSIIVKQIHHSQEPMVVNFSTLLSEKLHQEYSSLSRAFSAVEGITIERFVLKQKVERIKELMFYNEMTLSAIAHQMNYSSVAHLSSQFKKETGMTPSAFKKLNRPDRKPLDQL